MKLGELTTAHLGKTITVGWPGDSITGTLYGVNHNCPLEDVTNFGHQQRQYVPGPARTSISILGWGTREFMIGDECEVQDA